jgi:hypothetical protein
MSADINVPNNQEHETKARDLRNYLDKLVQENKLESQHVDTIIQEAKKNNFIDVSEATDDIITYTGWLTLYSGGFGAYYFSSWGGNFTNQGLMYPAIGVGLFLGARIWLNTKYDYDGCKGYMSFNLTPIMMTMFLSMDEKGNQKVGELAMGGLALAGGAGSGDFRINKY